MTVTFFLVRHAAHDNVGAFLAGRMPGIVLGEAGLVQAKRLGERMRTEKISVIFASPRERTRQTAEAIASACGFARPEISDALDEVDFGSWSGKTFDVLNTDPLWRQWNTVRSLTRTLGGETILDVQRRALALMEAIGRDSGGGRPVLVSHADVIKAVVCHILGLPIDAWPRFEIAPASITTVALGDWGGKVLTLNEVIS
jgi:broad specificity phosphatase PhoE